MTEAGRAAFEESECMGKAVRAALKSLHGNGVSASLQT